MTGGETVTGATMCDPFCGTWWLEKELSQILLDVLVPVDLPPLAVNRTASDFTALPVLHKELSQLMSHVGNRQKDHKHSRGP